MQLSADETQSDHRRWVVFINGPPGVGKDLAAHYILNYVNMHASWLRPRELKISEPIKKATHTLFNVDWTWNHFDHPGAPERHALKDVECPEFWGISPRQAYIDVATLIRDRYDIAFFGRMARRSMLRAHGSQLFLISDAGFADELGPIVEMCSAERVLVIELSRDEHSFASDSRSNIADELKDMYPKIKVQRIHNPEGDKELFRIYCHGAVKAFLNIEE